MSERIEVGDLVVIIKPTSCCGYSGGIGKIYIVGNMRSFRGRCLLCGAIGNGEPLACWGSGSRGVPTRRLKKLPPLTEPETITERDEMTA